MKTFFTELFRHIFVSILIVVLISLTAVNLTLANVAGETCGAIHPYIFNLNISMESERGLSISSIETDIPREGTSEVVNPRRATSDNSNSNENLQFTGEPLDTFLRIYNTNNELLAWNDDFVDFFAGIDAFQVSLPTEIIIEVGTFADSYRGAYTLYIAPSSVTDSIVYYDNPIEEPYQALPASSAEEGADELPETINLSEESPAIRYGQIEPNQRHRYHLTLSSDMPIYIDIFGDVTEPIPVRDSNSNDESAEASSQNYLFNRQANIEDEWSACLQYYGYFDGEQFNLSDNGVMRFILFRNTDALQELINLVNPNQEPATFEENYSIQGFSDTDGTALLYFLQTYSPISKRFLSNECNPEQLATIDTTNNDCTIRGIVTLSLIGRIVFYVILPIIVILLPVVTVWILRKQNILWWSLMMVLVAAQVMTTSLLFIHLSEISGIGALNDFGTGIFGGTITASALAFIGKVIENFSE